ncbi:hypothetical protein [Herbaspirillum seropedicae]|uniref:hypothetical protein n=1 Tax=Herbaspirillum seropedicae TaxID=964 RepID=UPI002856D826|nr:hypothetical protein [Herbaspirillum seropedicae]MDR6398299.1 hypothetical protein [Herbaspirillum seropedicae]
MTKTGKKKPYRQRQRSPPPTGPHSTAPSDAASATDDASLDLFWGPPLALLRNTGQLFCTHKKITAGKSPEKAIAGGKGIIVADDPDSVDPLG